MIFADTSGWYAGIEESDPNHVPADQFLRQNSERVITTDYVIDETLTLLRARGKNHRAMLLGEELFQSGDVSLYYLTPDDILAAWEVFQQFADKEWSFTDCTSKVVMEKLGITHAFSFDHHFRQFGTVIQVP